MTEPDDPAGSVDDSVDRDLLLRLGDGDDLALNDLVDRWRKPIVGFLYRTTGNFETAADLAQEVFVRVYRSRKRYRPKGSASSYLFTIAANLARNHFRWRKRHPEANLDEAVSARMDAAPDSSTPATLLERDEEGAAVRAAVQRLPEKLRTPVVLFHFNELPQGEIATIVGCSEKSVETRLYRARKLLREWL